MAPSKNTVLLWDQLCVAWCLGGCECGYRAWFLIISENKFSTGTWLPKCYLLEHMEIFCLYKRQITLDWFSTTSWNMKNCVIICLCFSQCVWKRQRWEWEREHVYISQSSYQQSRLREKPNLTLTLTLRGTTLLKRAPTQLTHTLTQPPSKQIWHILNKHFVSLSLTSHPTNWGRRCKSVNCVFMFLRWGKPNTLSVCTPFLSDHSWWSQMTPILL